MGNISLVLAQGRFQVCTRVSLLRLLLVSIIVYRKSAKLKGQYKNLIGGAKTGAAKGKKGLKMKGNRK